MNYKNILLFSALLFSGFFIQNGSAQCPSIEFIMANACDDASNAESDAEFMILNSGAGFNVDDLTVDFDSNNNGSGPTNLDIGPTSGCGFMFPFGAQLQVFGNPPPCPNVTLVGPGQSVPANVLVVIFTSSAMTGDTYDWSALCGAGQPVYLMQSDCDRTIGAFTDGTGSSSPRTTIISLPGPPACNDVLTYDRMNLVGGDGGWVMDDGAGGLTYGNGCAPPAIPLPCIPPGFNNPGNQTECGSYTLPAITGSTLTGNEIYSDMPNGGGTVYAAGDAITTTTTIYIFDPTQTCENPSFTVTINPLPVANPPASEVLICFILTPPSIVSENINAIENEITGGVPGLTVNWYTNAAGTIAIDWTNAAAVIALLPSPFTVFATVTDGNSCESPTVPVTANVEEAPTAAPASDQVCDDGTGMHVFDLTDYEATINGGTGAAVTYYSDAAGNNVIADPTMFTVNAPSGTAYASVASPNGCLSSPETITLTITPAPNLGLIDFTVSPTEACNSTNVDLTFQLPTAGTFDITMEADIAGVGVQTVNFSVMDGETVTFPTSITGTTVFTITMANLSSCPGGPVNVSHTVTIFAQPDIAPITDVAECGSYTLPSIPFDANPVGSASYWTGPGGTGTQYAPNDVITSSITPLYAYASSGTNCFDEELFDVVITPQPAIDPITIDPACGSYTLTDFSGTNLNQSGQHGYFTQPNAGGTAVNIGTVITTTTTLYAFDGTAPGCFDEEVAVITITPEPSIDPINIPAVCGTYTLTDFTGTNLNEPGVAHGYFTQPNAGGTAVNIGTTIATSTTLYAFDGTAPDCFDEVMFNITITPSPSVNPIDDVVECGEYTLPDFSGSNLNQSGNHGYFTQINGGGTQYAPGDVINATINSIYAFDGTFPDCYDQKEFSITITPAPNLFLTGDNVICAGDEIDIASLVTDLENTGHPITFHSGSPATPGNEMPTTLVMPAFSTSYYAYIDGGTDACRIELEIPVIVDPLPTAAETGMDACDDGTGQGVFNLTTLDNFISGGSFGTSVSWYLDLNHTVAVPDPTNFTSSTTIVYAIVNDGSCDSEPAWIDLNVLAPFSVDILEGTAIQCFGGSDANLVTSLTNGVPNFSYDWSNDAFDGIANPTGASAGVYSITVTDDNMCTAEDMITISQPEELLISCGEQTGVTSVGGDDGVAFVTITGGTADYTIAWSGTETGSMTEIATGTFNIANLMAGDYNILVTDGHGCTATCSFTITDPSCPMTLNISGTNPLCDGDTNGSIQLTVNNGVEPLVYDWNVDALDGTENPAMLGAGSYEVTVTGADGCSSVKSITLTAPAALTLTCGSPVNPTTVGGTDGQMTISFGGGTVNYTISWMGPVSGSQIEPAGGTLTMQNLSAGAYDVHIEDANGCTTDCNFTLSDPGCNIAFTPTVTAVSCFGSTDGAINLTMTAGNPPYDFNWSDDAYDGMSDLTNLPAGTYNVTVTDANLCPVSESIEVTQPTQLTISCGEGSQVSTVGGNDGVANITIAGGTAPYTLSWSGAASGTQAEASAGMTTITTLIAGDYTVTVTDDNNCSETCDFTITEVQPGCNMTLSIANTPNNCFGESQGSIDLTISNAIGTTVIDWNDDTLDGIEDPTGLAAGTYSVTVTDDNNCIKMSSTTLVDPEELTLSCGEGSQVSTAGGNDGVANITIAGGTAPYTLSWSGAASGTQAEASAGMTTITTLIAGDYTVTVTDDNNCSETCDFTITEVQPGCNMTLSIANTPNNCFGESQGSIDLTISNAIGSTVIDWDDDTLDGIEDPTGLAAGTYSVTVTDDNNCVKLISTTLVDPEELTLSCTQSEQASAPGASDGEATLTITGGNPPYVINWTGAASGMQNTNIAGDATISGLVSGSYMVTITDANNCMTNCEFNITEIGCMLAVNLIPTQVNCPGAMDGSILLEVTGAATPIVIDWSDDTLDGQLNPTGLRAGDYSVTVTDANDCSIVNNTTLTTLNEDPGVTVTAPTTVCSNECVNIDFHLEGTPPFLINTTIVELGVNAIIPSFSQDTTIVVCPESFGISNGTFTLAVTEVMDAGCSQLVNVVSVIQIEQPALFTLTETLCPGASITVNGQTYDADHATGMETLSGAAANGCDSIVTINLDYLPEITASIRDDIAICHGETAVLTFEISETGLYDVTFSDGVNLPLVYSDVSNGFSIQVNPLTTTTYFMQEVVAVGQDCPVVIENGQVTVSVSQLQADAEVVSEVSCGGMEGGAVQVLDTGGIPPITYLWSTGEETNQLFNLPANTYGVTVEDATGCKAEAEITLQPSAVFDMIVNSEDANCLYEASGSITIEEIIGGTGSVQYSLDGEFFETIGSVPFTLPQQKAGTYTIHLRDEAGCLTEADVVITAAEELILELGDNEIINLGDSIQLQGIANFTPAEIHWSPAETLSDPESLITYAKPSISTTYTLLVLDEAGCSAQNFIQILVNKRTPIFIPNAFSPNGDGINDVLFINAKINSIREIRSFYIYDRWGEMVFTVEHFLPNNPDYGWNGLLDGRPLNPAVFVYTAEVEFIDGHVEVLSGDVVLVK